MSAVQISFECLPLRSVGRLDVPLDASPEERARFERLKQAIARHGAHNSYFLANGDCRFHLTNSETIGLVRFRFEGTVLTDENDLATRGLDLDVELVGETCDWLTRPVAEWFAETVKRAVAVEFDRYIASGDLVRAIARAERIRQASDAAGGYLGMNV